jgi:hypothetical protein
MRPIVRAALLSGMLLTAGIAHSQGTPKPSLPTLTFDLRSRNVSDVLPFEQRFNIRGSVDNDVVAGTASYLELGTLATCPRAAPNTATSLGSSDAFGANDQRQLGFSVPPLEHSKDYCFWFDLTRPLSPTALSTFRERALGPIDTFFQGVGTPSTLTVPQLGQLRDELRTQLENAHARPGTKLAPDPGSIFHATTPASVLDVRFARPIGIILAAQRNRNQRILTYCTERSILTTDLDTAAHHADLQAVISAVHNARAKDPIKEFLTPDAMTGIAILKDDTLNNAAGNDPLCNGDAPSPALTNAWHDIDIAATADTWSQHRTGLVALQRVLARAAADAGVRTVLGVSEAAVTSALAQLESVVDTIDLFAEDLRTLRTLFQQRLDGITQLIREAGEHIQSTVPLLTTSLGDFTTRHNWYVSADVGIAHAWEIDKSFTYVGMNVYLRPINKEVPLRGIKNTFTKRFSFLFGATLQELKRDGAFEGVMGNRTLVLGAGLRVLDSIRVNGGVIVLNEFDPNPLVTSTTTAVSPFVAISVDWDVRSTFARLGTVFNIPQ